MLSLMLVLSYPLTQAQITPAGTDFCPGDQIIYHTPFSFGASYNWSVSGGMVIGSNVADSVVISWGNAGSGIISVIVNYPSGPPAFFFQNVTIHPKPTPGITHLPYPGCPATPRGQGPDGTGPGNGHDACEKVCKYAQITYSTILNAGSTYSWTATGAQAISGQFTSSATVTWDATAFGSLTVYETTAWGCVDSSTICIEKVDLPVAAFTHQLNVCLGSTVTFNNQSTGGVSYQWYFGDGGYSTLFNPTHSYTSGGTYTITLIVTNACHCTDTIRSTINVDSQPGPDISCPSTLCAYSSGTYSTSVSGCIYNWFVIGGTISGPSNQQSVTVNWGAGQLGMLGLYVSGCAATCSDTTWVQIPIVPAVAQISGPDKVCPGDCAEYSLPNFSGATYKWWLNANSCGSIQDSTCCGKITICYPSFGFPCDDTLFVSFYDSLLQCGGIGQKIIHFRPKLEILGSKQGCANGISYFSAFPGLLCTWNISPAGPVYAPGPAMSLSVDWNGLTGPFTVTAIPVNPNQACNDSASILVNVIPPPAKPVIVGDTLVCPNSTNQYCVTGTGNISWIITGGSPAAGTGNCITVSWGNTPPFIIQAYNMMPGSPFCSSDTALQNINVMTSLAIPVINGNHNACANMTAGYSTSISLPAGATYAWSMIPANAGSITSGQNTSNIQIEWGNNAPQTVVLSLTVSVCGLTATDTFNVHLRPIPLPVVVQLGPLCLGTNTQLAVTGGVFTAYQWSGPGAFTSISASPTIFLNGLYQVTVTDPGGCTAISQLTVVYVGSPTASISSANLLSYCAGSSYTVNLCALGNPNYTYQWSNGPTGQCITVNATGSFLVTVTDASNGCMAISNVMNVTEFPCTGSGGSPCIPDGSISFSHSGCNPKVFTNTSVNGSSFSWDFGDLSGSNATSPTHTYTQAGFFVVTLSGFVPNMAHTDSCLLLDTAAIEIPLLAKFDIGTACEGMPVCFTDKSAFTVGNNITSWLWNFGDATTSNLQNPCHQYPGPATYTVTLTISNGTCTTSITHTVIVQPKPTAAFSFSNNACINTSVLFTDNSFSNVNYWNWAFGNAGTSLNQNPSATYMTGGIYPVTLIIHDIYGCYDTTTQNITVNNPSVSGNIIAYPDTIVCAGTTVSLAAPACAGCTYAWSTGSVNDSITVTNTGIYAVNITDLNGCVYSTHIKIIVLQKPQAVITSTKTKLCLGEFATLSVQFNQKWLYSWISNDLTVNGNPSSMVSIFPASPGTYTYQVAINDTSTGCSDTTLPFVIQVFAPPASPTISALGATTVCSGDTITLVIAHPDSTITFGWNTGDINDTIDVFKTGCYTAIATDTNGCASSASLCVTVNPLPELCSFYEGCFDTCAPFLIPGPAGGISYQWLLSGIPIPGANAQNYLATTGGNYSLIITNVFGCVDTTGILQLSLTVCPSDLCAEFLIDSVYCSQVNGQYIMDYHVINNTLVPVAQVMLQVLAPNLGLIYAPTVTMPNIPPGDTSATISATIFNGVGGSTLCFRTRFVTYDSTENLLLDCISDTLCVKLPICPPVFSCDSLHANFSTSISGLNASFNDLSWATGGMIITAWAWNFGDPGSGANNVSSIANPSHVFTGQGTYIVCLIVTGMDPTTGLICHDTICKDVVIHCDLSMSCPPSYTMQGCSVFSLTGLPFSEGIHQVNQEEFAGAGGIVEHNCGPVTIAYHDITNGHCPTIVIRTWILTDGAGNSINCQQTITIQDVIPPIISCPANISVNNEQGICGAHVNYTVIAGDNCGVPTKTLVSGLVSGSLFPVGTTTVIHLATDACGNTSTCSFTVIVQDHEGPSILVCPQDYTTIGCSINVQISLPFSQEIQLVSLQAFAGAGEEVSDNCGIVYVAYSDVASGICPIVITRTWILKDAAGNTVSCVQHITIQDTVPPTILCPQNILADNDPGICGAIVSYNVLGSDNCGRPVMSIISGPVSGSLFPVGTTTVSYLATDACGNTTSCYFTVTVTDHESPNVLECPPSFSVEGCSVAVLNNIPYSQEIHIVGLEAFAGAGGYANDNCGIVYIAYSDIADGKCPIHITRTWILKDAAGNITTCIQNITIEDTTPPVIDCIPDIDESAAEDLCGLFINYTILAHDLCGNATVTLVSGLPSGSLFPVGTSTVVMVATDECGNTSTCSFKVSIHDTKPPVISCPPNITLNNSPGLCGAFVNCYSQIKCFPQTGKYFEGLFTQEFGTAYSISNPVLSAFSPCISLPANPGIFNTHTFSFNFAATLNRAGLPPVQINSPAQLSMQIHMVVQNSTEETFNLEILSMNLGGTSLPDGLMLRLSPTESSNGQAIVRLENGQYGTDSFIHLFMEISTDGGQNWIPANASGMLWFKCPIVVSDNCPGPLSISQISGLPTYMHYPYPIGTTINTYLVTDASGNTASCSFSITVLDTEPPHVTHCPADIAYEGCLQTAMPGLPYSEAMHEVPFSAFTEAGGNASDNCGIVYCAYADVITGTCPVHITRTWTLKDAAGHIVTCTQHIMIVDNVPPQIVCPTNITQNAATGQCAAVVHYTITATDNCGTAGLQRISGPESGSVFPVGTSTVAYFATDGCGNSSFCSFTVTVIDNQAPVISCPPNTVACISPNGGPTFVENIGPSVFENCQQIVVWYTMTGATTGGGSSNASGQAFNLGVTTVTYIAYDQHLNSSSCSFTVTVSDNIVVTFNCDYPSQCPGNAPFALSGGYPAGGTYSGPGVSGGMFYPALAATGPNVITYSVVVQGGCSGMANCTINVMNTVRPVVYVGSTPGNDYSSLSGALGLFADINARGLCSDVIAYITSNITEPGITALNQWTEFGPGGYHLTITPQGAPEKTLQGNFVLGIIRLNGADRVWVKGESGSSATRLLRFRNNSLSGPVFNLYNGATNNKLTYCTIEGSNGATNSGLLVFGSGSGNSNNTISHNLFKQAEGLPLNHIYASGTAASPNNTNTITNNEFRNFKNNGILVSATGNGNAWKIEMNSFYWDLNSPASLAQTAINFTPGPASLNNSISSNTIGGASVSNAGFWINSGAITFKGISVSAGTSQIHANVVKNIGLSNPGGTNFMGIELLAGIAGIGSPSTPNIIGDSVSSNSIMLSGLCNFFGIRNLAISPGSAISGNVIANITSTVQQGYPNMYGIYTRTGDVSKNTIFKIGTSAAAAIPTIFGIMNLGYSNFFTNLSNNRIALDGGASTNPRIIGIQDNAYAAAGPIPSAQYGHNSVEIYGGPTTFSKTYAFHRNFNGIVYVNNNIYSNRRSSSPVGHYAISTTNTTGWNSNYNDLYVSSANLGFWNAGNTTNLAAWKLASGKDAASQSVAPVFVSVPNDLHLSAIPANAALNNYCPALGWVPDDIDAQSRAGLVDFGADEIALGPRLAPEIPQATAELNVYPNPFESGLQLSIDLGADARISLCIFNILGDKVADVAEENLISGKYEYRFAAHDLPAGVYLVRMIVATADHDKVIVKRIVKDR